MKVYVNGSFVGSATGVPPWTETGTTPFSIGNDTALAQQINGVIYDFITLNKELSALEVSQIYGLGGSIGAYEDTAYWKGSALWRPSYPAV
jgi:hypothetical protein